MALLADLRWKRPFGLHRARSDALPCGDLTGVRKADVLSSGVWRGDSCPFPVQLYGGDQVMFLPRRQRTATHRCPLAFRDRVEGRVARWVRCIEAGLVIWLISPGKPLWARSMGLVGDEVGGLAFLLDLSSLAE